MLRLDANGTVLAYYSPPNHPLTEHLVGRPAHLSQLRLNPDTLAFILDQLPETYTSHCEMVYDLEPELKATCPDWQPATYFIRLTPDTHTSALTETDWPYGQHSILCFIQDITQRKQSELLTESYYTELLESRSQIEIQSLVLGQQTEALQLANQQIHHSAEQKMAFITQISHEIRTPINGLIGLSQLLQDTPLNINQLDLVDSIKLSANTLLNTINELLDFSKMEAGFFTLNIGNCDLRQHIRNACDVITPLVNQKNLELVTFIDPQLPACLTTDGDRLQQVILNLLSNACKYTNFGTIELRVKSETFSNQQAHIHISVKDSGIGIPEDKQHLLFQQFSQLHQASDITTPVQSTGLGLAICKNIVELMQGEIGVTSRPGDGSTFWFTFTAPVETPADPSYMPYRQIVLVEENPMARDVRRAAFEYLGCRVIVEPSFEGLLRHPLADAVVISYPFDDGDTDMRNALIHELLADNVPVFCLVNRRVNPNLTFPVTGLLHRPLNTDVLLQQLTQPLKLEETPVVASSELPPTIPESVVLPLTDHLTPKPATLGHVLVVEDNLVNQKVVTKFLDHLHYSYDVANNGIQAIKAIKTTPYDLVLMDCQMPQMDGYEASRVIRQELQLNHLPIIALTAHALAGERQKCLDAGMNDYLTKPIAKQQLDVLLCHYIQPGQLQSLN
jgi:two-component system, sensor histidine kinase and response regulator